MRGFEILERLHSSARTQVQRARSAGRTVILKSPGATIPDQQSLSRYREEYALLRRHTGLGLAEALDLVEQAGQVQLVLSDIGGIDLTRLLQQQKPDWRQTLKIMLRAAEILARAHERGLVHGRIAPEHIICSPCEVQIVDWVGEPQADSHYLAPEQTGRLQREVDARADLYGLGATAWYLLTGQVPFAAHSDPLSLQHARLAVELPPLPSELPASLSTLLAGLLAKDPEQRYPNARRLLDDVRQVLEHPDRPLLPARPGRPYFPGREKPMATLLEGLAAAARGQLEVIALTGAAGVGKSTLAGLLRLPTQTAGGFFAQGRHQQFHAQQPHQALVEALSHLIDQLLGHPQAQIQQWRAQLQGQSAALLPILPKLKHFIEGQAVPLETLEGAGARMRLALAGLIRALSKICQPLVLFLDDLHWGDEDSWQLLEFVAVDPEGGGLLLLLGWRGQGRLKPRSLLQLEGLEPADLTRWLEEICPGATPAAAAMLHRKTGGNPFFVRAVLRRLHNDLSQLAELEITDNVVDSLLEQMRRLPQEASQALAMAACLGSSFRLEPLGPKAEEHLQPALELAMLEAEPTGFRFSHDRIQEAAYQLLDETERGQTHLRLGRFLLHQEDCQLSAVEQLGKGLTAMQDPAERLLFARKSLEAARLAARSSAFEIAFQLLSRARQALPGDHWNSHYQLSLDILNEFNRVSLALGRHPELEAGLAEQQRHARRFADEIPVWTLRLRMLIGQGKMHDAYALSEQFLQRCGRSQPRSASLRSVAWALLQTRVAIGRRSPEDLLQLPEATDPILCGVQEVQVLATLCQARVRPDTIPLAILRDIRTVLADGVTAYGAQCWTGYGLILCAIFGQVQLGRRYGELALRQVERLRRPDLEPRIASFVCFLIVPWSSPLTEVGRLLRQVVARAFEVGDVEAGFFARVVADRLEYHSGLDLVTMLEKVQATQNALQHHQHQNGVWESAWLYEAIRALRHGQPPRWPQGGSQDDLVAQVSNQILQLQLALVFGELRQAFEQAQQQPPLQNPSLGMLPFLYWTYAMAALLHGFEQGWCDWGTVAGPLAQARKVTRKWSVHVQARRWRGLWIEVSLKRARGGAVAEILSDYDQVIALARDSGFAQDAALICEFAADFCFRLGRHRLAEVYRQDGLALYQQWGALAKLEQAPRPDVANLDVETILRSARVLSGEMRLSELLSSLVKLALENAGAQRGVLVLRRVDGWRLAVQASAQQTPQLSDSEIDLEQPQEAFPSTVLRYCARTRETVILNGPGQFAADAYFVRQQPLALICQPLEHAQQLIGLLYLENQLAATTFSATSVQVLQALSGQMAISLQNALHFQQVLAERDLRHQEALKNQSLTARREALAAVLGMASHDLRNPLAAIRMWMSQLGSDPSPEQLSTTRKNVESACLRAQDLTALYLDTAALESGRNLELRLQTCDVDVLVEGEIEFLLDSLPPEERLQAGLEWDLVPMRAEVDRERMRQVIANLVGNALKYCPPGTPILVRLSQQKDLWELCVSDSGPGLALELQAGLFQAFERRGDAQIQGTGLGLWICRVIVEAHGGTIGVDSSPQGGCSFWCRLPHSVLRRDNFCEK